MVKLNCFSCVSSRAKVVDSVCLSVVIVRKFQDFTLTVKNHTVECFIWDNSPHNDNIFQPGESWQTTKGFRSILSGTLGLLISLYNKTIYFLILQKNLGTTSQNLEKLSAVHWKRTKTPNGQEGSDSSCSLTLNRCRRWRHSNSGNCYSNAIFNYISNLDQWPLHPVQVSFCKVLRCSNFDVSISYELTIFVLLKKKLWRQSEENFSFYANKLCAAYTIWSDWKS